MSIQWVHYPKSVQPPQVVKDVVDVFDKVFPNIDSSKHKLVSNDVLSQLALGLNGLGFDVERGKRKDEKISIPVLYGMNGKVEKSFDADAYHKDSGFVLEVEAGRAVANNQFLKDLFQACMMHDVRFLGIAARKVYEGGNHRSRDFEKIVTFFDTLYASNRLQLPLKGITVIGY